MKSIKYIVLLSLIISAINLHAMNKKPRPGIQFPQTRLHRHCLPKEKEELKKKLKTQKERDTKLLAALLIADDEVKKTLTLLDEQASEKAAEILAAIDSSILATLNLESPD